MKRLVTKALTGVSGLVPKDKKLWLFGAWEGKSYSDNSKYMFEYVLKNHPEIKAIWLTKSEKVIHDLRQQGRQSFHRWSVKGLWYAFRAGVAFETEGDGDVSTFLNGTLVIQLWHGLGIKAFKWIGDDGVPLFSPELIERHKLSYWMTTSGLYNDILHQLMDIPFDHMVVTGYPRNDALVERPTVPYFEKLRENHPDETLMIYMPTHRNFGKGYELKENPCDYEHLKQLDEMLGAKSIYMIYKPHFHELSNLIRMNASFEHILLATDEDVFSDVYSYIHYCDVLVSDYSTIIYEFACTGKPVILFPYDLDEYKNLDGGLLKEYWDYQVGPFCYTWQEVLDQVHDFTTDDTWRDKRESCREAWHRYNDGKNRERVYRSVMNLLNKR